MMRKKLFVITLIIFIFIAKSQSQGNNDSTIPNIIPPTHQTFALSKVNFNANSDGKFHYSVPLFPIDDVLNTNVSLNYNSDVKVDDIGGTEGISWRLSYGGVISRVVKDETDEGSSLKWRPESVNETVDLLKIREAARAGNYVDTEYDWFNFNISNGISGSFYIDENFNVFSQNSQDVKIQVFQIGTSSTEYGKKLEIKITDSYGNQYYFGGDDQYIERTIYKNSGSNKFAVTGWYLRKITTYKNEDIVYEYDIDRIKYLSSASASFNIKQICSPTGGNSYVYSDISKTKSITDSFTPRVKFINTKSKKISFTYDKFRNDISSSKLLTAISLNDKSLHQIKKINIDYFDVTSTSAATYYDIPYSDVSTTSRHFLKSVTDSANINDKYSFEYFDINLIPGRFSLNTDYYNYYNSQLNNSPFPQKTINNNVGILDSFANIIPYSVMSANKEVNPANVEIGNLKKIIYPTKGFSEIFYEGNYFNKDIISYIPTTEEIKLDINPCKSVNIVGKSFEFKSNSNSVNIKSTGGSYHFECNPEDDSLHDNYVIQFILKSTGEVLETVNQDLLVEMDHTFYTNSGVDYIITFLLASRFTTPEITFNIEYNFVKITNQIPQYIGGHRVNKVEEHDGSGQKYIKKYYYNPLFSPSSSMGSMVGFVDDKTIIEKGEYSRNCQQGETLPDFRILDIYRVYENSIFSDFNDRGNEIFYTNITEVIDGYSAKESEFSYEDDIDPNFLRNPYYSGISKSNYGQIYRGNLMNEKNYEFKNGIFKIIEEKEYTYGYIVQSSKNNFFFKEHFTYFPHPLDDQLRNISYGFYTDYYGFRKQTQVKTTSFSNNSMMKNKTDFIYSGPSHHQVLSQKTEFPDKSIQETKFSYAHEKGNTDMIAANMIGIPLETEVKKYKDSFDVSPKTISKSGTDYTKRIIAGNSLILPDVAYNYDLESPSTATTEIKYNEYDDKGNLLQYTLKPDSNGNGGIPVAIIWGYNKTQPIAKIEGATYLQVANFVNAIINNSNTDAGQPTNNDETELLTTMDTFRKNLAEYQVTTYTYDPLVGVRSITPPSGIREYYIYDTANRLQSVKDVNGKILKEYKYNYKP